MKIVRVKQRKNSANELEHITHEMYKQNLELSDKNKTLTLLRQIDEVVLGPVTDVEKVAQMITDLLVKDSDFSLALLYITDVVEEAAILTALSATAKIPHKLGDTIRKNIGELPVKKGHKSEPNKALFAKSPTAIKGLAELQPESAQKIDETEAKTALNYQSLYVCPLGSISGLVGVLILGLPIESPSDFQKNLIERLTGTISIAMQNHLLYAELQAASAKLKSQNRKLKELDKSKDEFISMASHQLRTPLTSVKGYLSMVLEGDVGPVTKEEKAYIKRAFDSAQKMVYLIADLLNVSRLQTGKFVIENKPTNLAQVVEEEASQLAEQMEAKKITFVYHKPASFPVLNLDDTKIRQVVMNFLDNAVYYTPNGGKVTAEVRATDDTVSYTITDTGIGVPKNLQPHLFSKFYRADNARKMRPDGTGLGLFMAKKVIVAEGGSILFSSTEGKGSTFGFSFPRKTMEIKGGEVPATPVNAAADPLKSSVAPANTPSDGKLLETAQPAQTAKPVEAALK